MEKPYTRKTVELTSGGIQLKGELDIPRVRAPLIVLCHGIPLALPDPSDGGYSLFADLLSRRGYASLFINLRGTGESGGDFHLGGWYRDLSVVMDFARVELAGEFTKLFMAGFSAGGALAIKYAALRGGVDGVASFAAPARLSEVFPRAAVKGFLEIARSVGIIKDESFPPNPEWFYDDLVRNDAVDYVSRLGPIPLLIVHGEEDETVPVEQGKMLFNAAGDPKELRLLPGGLHRLRKDPRAIECLTEWLERLN